MLIMYHGLECPHCRRMDPLVERLEKEHGVTVERRETWHDPDNAAKLSEHDAGFCGGVPFFIDTETGKKLCGAVPYETLVAWASVE